MEISIAEFKRKYPGIRKYTTDTLGTIEDIIDVRGGYGDALVSLSKLDKKKCKEIQQTLNTEFTGIRTMIVGAIEHANPIRAEFNVSTLNVKVATSETIGDNVFSNFNSKYDAERQNILKQFKKIDDFLQSYHTLKEASKDPKKPTPFDMMPTAFRIISYLVNIIKSLDVLIALNNNIGTYLDGLPDNARAAIEQQRVYNEITTIQRGTKTQATQNAMAVLAAIKKRETAVANVQGVTQINADTAAAAIAARRAMGLTYGGKRRTHRKRTHRTHRKRTHRKRKHTRRH